MSRFILMYVLISIGVLGCSSANISSEKKNIDLMNKTEIISEFNATKNAKTGDEIFSVKNIYRGVKSNKKVFFEGANTSLSNIMGSYKSPRHRLLIQVLLEIDKDAANLLGHT